MQKPNKDLILWLAVAAIGVTIILFSSYSRRTSQDVAPISPTLTPVAETASPTPSPLPSQSSEDGFESFVGLKEPASCRVTGEIEFLEQNLYSSKDAKIFWKNVDSQGRLINWTVEPKDDLAVGPNLFASMTVPDGDWGLTVRLPENPIAKEYKLKASVTYGQLIKGNVEVKEAVCAGEVVVKINY